MSFTQADRMKNAPLSKIRVIMNKCAQLEQQGKRVIQFTVGEPDFGTPEYIRTAVKKAVDAGRTKYPPVDGIAALRNAVSAKLARENGLSYEPGEILITNGVAQGMFLAMMSWLDPGDEIIVPDPGYNSYTTIPNVAGAVMKRYNLLEENDFQIDIEEFAGLITDKTKMVVFISPNNPIGSVLRKDTIEALAGLLKDKDILVLSDEIYEKLHYDGEKPVSIAAYPGMKEKTIVLNGFSKYFSMTGWRLGYAAAPSDLLEPMVRLNFLTTAGVCAFVQEAGAAALEEDDGDCEKMRLEFQSRRDYLVEQLNRIHKLSCLRPEGAFYVFLNIKKTGMTSEKFADYLLEECQVAVVPGTVFGKNGEGFVRLSYATSIENITEAVKRIKAAVDKL